MSTSATLSAHNLITVKNNVDECNPWRLKKHVSVRGGGTLKIFTKDDDEESYLYELKTPLGKSVILRRYRGECSLDSFDPSSNKSRYISISIPKQ